MSYPRIIVASCILGWVELSYAWRIAVLDVAPDLLLILAIYLALKLKPSERIAVACAIGLLSDFVMGSRLGLMAIGYGAGARIAQGLAPLSGTSSRNSDYRMLGQMGSFAVAVFAGSFVCHSITALLVYLFGDLYGSLPLQLLRGIGITTYTVLAAPGLWLLFQFAAGRRGGTLQRSRPLMEH